MASAVSGRVDSIAALTLMLDAKAPAQPTEQNNGVPQAANPDLRRIAAIDIGTNSFHLLVAAVDPKLRTFRIIQAEKATTRLGERDPETGELTSAAMQRGLETLRQFRDLAASHRVEQIVTAATSAVREAPNGRDFLQTILDDLGMEVDLVSGPEEARLIYLGVLSGMPFGDRPHLLLDIGGGSTELILADGRDARALTSTRVGAVRLQRDFVRDDPMPPQRRSFLQAFIQGSLEPAVKIKGDVNLSPTADLREATANLFSMLHELDARAGSKIAVAPIPNHGLGIAINDRLTRAAAPRS